MTTLEAAALKTLAYFDQFSHPLTARELFYWLWQPETMTEAEFWLALPQLVEAAVIEEKNGFYFLPGQARLVEIRAQNFFIQDQKIALAKKATKYLALVPFIKGIFICNTVASGWPTKESDVDLFVVVEPNHLWLTRSLFTGLTALLNKRRHGARISDHLCLSFYVTEHNLNLKGVRITEPDVYLTYWAEQLMPIFGPPDLYPRFLLANNWLLQNTPNVELKVIHQNTVKIWPGFLKVKEIIEQLLGGQIGDWLEKKAKYYQLARMKRTTDSPPNVVISDTMLKFHEADRRLEYQQKWQQKLIDLGL